jgi:hypothetical protein
MPVLLRQAGMPVLLMRTIVIAGMLLGVSAPGALKAQERLLNRLLQNNWLRYRIVGGRIMIDGARLDNVQHTVNGTNLKETFSIRNENGQPALRYERTTNEDQIMIDAAAAGDRLLIRRTPREKSSILAVEFSQLPNEKITLTLGTGAERQVFRGQGLWHLLIAQPKECRQQLLPLLEMLRPDWKLADTAASIEEKLLRDAGGERVSGRARWATLVAQLADESFAKREAADRALRMDDAGAIDYLRRLDFSRLDAEQQFRVSRIIEALGQANDDSVDQVAAVLAGDPTVWLALLARPELATRQTAARQLTALLGEPIAVDPAADPVTQKDKREQLRTRIDGN